MKCMRNTKSRTDIKGGVIMKVNAISIKNNFRQTPFSKELAEIPVLVPSDFNIDYFESSKSKDGSTDNFTANPAKSIVSRISKAIERFFKPVYKFDSNEEFDLGKVLAERALLY